MSRPVDHLQRSVSISGETTAPLPLKQSAHEAGERVSFNLRRDHRSLATSCNWMLGNAKDRFQSQARPPLPCHRSWRRERIAATVFQSQARPPLPCHARAGTVKSLHMIVSISGETTAPLPLFLLVFYQHLEGVSISGETTAPLPPTANRNKIAVLLCL